MPAKHKHEWRPCVHPCCYAGCGWSYCTICGFALKRAASSVASRDHRRDITRKRPDAVTQRIAYPIPDQDRTKETK